MSSMILRAILVVSIGLAACSTKPDASSAPAKAAASAVTASPRPSFGKRRLLLAQGKAAFVNGDWDACARQFEAAQAWLEAARCIAHTRDLDRAFEDLQRGLAEIGPGKAVAIGALRDDPDLKALVRDPRWLAVVGDAETQRAAYQSHQNAELAQLARSAEPAELPPAPPRMPDAADAKLFAERVARVAEILDGHGATTADDYFHAALVYYRADTEDDAGRAHELALAGIEHAPDSDELKWLAAASEDRQLKHESKPQKFGTQLVMRGAHYTLWNVDPAISDAERDRWSVASLAEAIANAESPGGNGETVGPL